MQGESNIAFKEWAVVVEALGQGEQILILRKGGIHEERGQFRPDYPEFWLFPTQFHEAESSVIASKRPALRAIAAAANPGELEIRYLARAEAVFKIDDFETLKSLQGRHIWSEHVLQQRFQFGREQGLFAFLVRVWQRTEPVRLPVRESYGGCKSWIELERPLSTAHLTPVLPETDFGAQRDAISALLAPHAHAHS